MEEAELSPQLPETKENRRKSIVIVLVVLIFVALLISVFVVVNYIKYLKGQPTKGEKVSEVERAGEGEQISAPGVTNITAPPGITYGAGVAGPVVETPGPEEEGITGPTGSLYDAGPVVETPGPGEE